MWGNLLPRLHLLWQSKVWVALGAIAIYRSQVLASQGSAPWDTTYAILLFLSTLSLYQLHQLDFVYKHRFGSIMNTSFRTYLLALVSMIVITILLSAFWGYLLHMLFPALIALAYVSYNLIHSNLPIVPQAWKNTPYLNHFLLKSKGWLKPISLALAWSWICSPPGHINCIVLTYHACYVFAIALYFDVKDINSDHLAGIRTPAGILGANQTAILSCLFAGFFFLFADFLGHYLLRAVALASYILIITIRSLIIPQFTAVYFYFGVESLLFLPWLIQYKS
jgi:hypothetical protein